MPSQEKLSRGHSDPVDKMLAKERGHRVHEMVVSSAVLLTFNETAMHEEVIASNRLAKANRKSWSMSEVKE